ncbi:unnamed protein product, partial [marine sediment metagenome]
ELEDSTGQSVALVENGLIKEFILTSPPSTGDTILLEDGFNLLLEDGSNILLEA